MQPRWTYVGPMLAHIDCGALAGAFVGHLAIVFPICLSAYLLVARTGRFPEVFNLIPQTDFNLSFVIALSSSKNHLPRQPSATYHPVLFVFECMISTCVSPVLLSPAWLAICASPWCKVYLQIGLDRRVHDCRYLWTYRCSR